MSKAETIKVQVTMSLPDAGTRLSRRPATAFTAKHADEENSLVCIEDSCEYQEIKGFGGAITESAAHVWKSLPPVQQRKAIKALFDPKAGLGLTQCRLHINSCDFSLENFACDETDGDFALRDFSVERYTREIFPMAKAAEAAAGRKLWILASPWSPPAWMKTTGQMDYGGKLRPECRKAWADYYARFVLACRENGIDIAALTVQNEPKATQYWDSCVYTAEEERDFLRDFLAPALRKAKLGKSVALYFWDHNKERALERATVMMSDPRAAKAVAGIGFHWYSGDHFEQLDMVHRRFPKLELFATECCTFLGDIDREPWGQAESYAHDIIGNLNHGMSRWVEWNLMLDRKGGPAYVQNVANAPLRANADFTGFIAQPVYYAVGHFSRFFLPGARRIGTSSFSRNVEATAARNADGSFAAVLHNASDKDIDLKLRFRKLVAPLSLPAHAIATCAWHG